MTYSKRDLPLINNRFPRTGTYPGSHIMSKTNRYISCSCFNSSLMKLIC